ncbi:hypothetical protein DNTS_010299 [Danionella cerebrum]|uniref:Uncharacterized protein n=1 Tax=Danionella cerebrum TaxID=2873325 RepID=A0A553MRC0_9TELE|nr:hypothetical protein DNTS_010299 [Danionella translucida]
MSRFMRSSFYRTVTTRGLSQDEEQLHLSSRVCDYRRNVFLQALGAGAPEPCSSTSGTISLYLLPPPLLLSESAKEVWIPGTDQSIVLAVTIGETIEMIITGDVPLWVIEWGNQCLGRGIKVELVSGGRWSLIVELLTGFASNHYIKVSRYDKQSAHQQIKKLPTGDEPMMMMMMMSAVTNISPCSTDVFRRVELMQAAALRGVLFCSSSLSLSRVRRRFVYTLDSWRLQGMELCVILWVEAWLFRTSDPLPCISPLQSSYTSPRDRQCLRLEDLQR